ncbi:MAG: hypothetical protein JWP20_687 [Roseomonas sp.]|nr:hypothetical protein [Roseomonas sp.]
MAQSTRSTVSPSCRLQPDSMVSAPSDRPRRSSSRRSTLASAARRGGRTGGGSWPGLPNCRGGRCGGAGGQAVGGRRAPPVIMAGRVRGNISTSSRCARMKAAMPAMHRKCTRRAHSWPPKSVASQDNCTGLHSARPEATASAPSTSTPAYIARCTALYSRETCGSRKASDARRSRHTAPGPSGRKRGRNGRSPGHSPGRAGHWPPAATSPPDAGRWRRPATRPASPIAGRRSRRAVRRCRSASRS